ncbi:MAG: GldG family protein [Balneolaceae bacterium]|nr:GldG family protein [Balneolaceae bacterium]
MNKLSVFIIAISLALGFLFLNLIGDKLDFRIDTTRDSLYSLSSQSKQILDRLDEEVHIIHFYLQNDPRYSPTLELLREYQRSSPNISVELYDINSSPSVADRYNVRFQGTTIIRKGDRIAEVYGSDEVSISNGIYQLLHQSDKKIYFTGGHGEFDIFSRVSEDHLELEGEEDRPIFLHQRQGMLKLKETLELMSFEVDKLFLQQEGRVPDDADLLVIASPLEPFLPMELQAIRTYLENGGNVLVTLRPFLDGGLSPLLNEYGILPQNNMVIDFGNHFWNDAMAPAVGSYEEHPITRDMPLTFFPGIQEIEFVDPVPDHIKPLILFTSTEQSAAVNSQSEIENLRNANPVYRPHNLMAVVEVQQNQTENRIAVIGSGGFATNEYLNYLGNQRLMTNTINWLMAEEVLLDLEPVTYELPVINLTNRQLRNTFIISSLLIPGLFVIAGVFVWYRRRIE